MPRPVTGHRRSARGDAGFTLPEVLVALIISMIVAGASLTILNVTMKNAGEIEQRVDSTQRGRMLMDTMTRELRSQVCMTTDVPPIRQTTGGTSGGNYTQSVSFYADMTDGRANPAAPELRTLAYDANARTITETVQAVQAGSPPPPGVIYGAASSIRIIGSNVVRDTDAAGNPLPIFTYFGFTAATPTDPATPTLALPTAMALNDPNVKMVAKVGVRFRMVPSGRKNATRTATVFSDDVYVRAADPNDPAPIPTCA
jgi:prepilin-type N-terminal cleavage/methylation domain-containing protein